jgi:hypothetical protein
MVSAVPRQRLHRVSHRHKHWQGTPTTTLADAIAELSCLVRMLLVHKHNNGLHLIVILCVTVGVGERRSVRENRGGARGGIDGNLDEDETRGQARHGRHARAAEVHDAVRVMMRGRHLVDTTTPERRVREHEHADAALDDVTVAVIFAPRAPRVAPGRRVNEQRLDRR